MINKEATHSQLPEDALQPLRRSYRAVLEGEQSIPKLLGQARAALLSIDLQQFGASPNEGIFKDIEKLKVPVEALEYYLYQLKNVVIPNTGRLMEEFRTNGWEVIHVRIQSLTRDGRDRSLAHKRLGLHAAPGSKEAEFLEGVKPQGDEIIVNKTASGVFTSTNLEYVLRNLDVAVLYVAGVFTNECVSTTLRDGADRGFSMTMVSDGCAAITPELHRSSIETLRHRYCRIMTCDEVLEECEQALNELKDSRG